MLKAFDCRIYGSGVSKTQEKGGWWNLEGRAVSEKKEGKERKDGLKPPVVDGRILVKSTRSGRRGKREMSKCVSTEGFWL